MEESSKSVMQVEFDIGHMAGVFIVLVFGLAFSVAFFLFKKFYLLAKQQDFTNSKPGLNETDPEVKNEELKVMIENTTNVQ